MSLGVKPVTLFWGCVVILTSKNTSFIGSSCLHLDSNTKINIAIFQLLKTYTL